MIHELKLALDTETALITERCKAPDLVCVSYAEPVPDENIALGLLHWTESEPYVKRWLEDSDRLLIGANIAYDFGVLVQQFPNLMPLVWKAYVDDRVEDVQLRQKLIDIARGTSRGRPKGSYSLAGLMKRHFEIDLEKDEWRLRYSEFRDIPLEDWPEGAKHYSKTDAEATLLVYEAQEEFVPLLEDSFRQARGAWWLHLMSAWGIVTDREAVERLAYETQQKYDELEEMLFREGLVKKTGKRKIKITRDTKAAKARMQQVMAGSGHKLTAKGSVSLDRDACIESGDSTLEAYAEFAHLKHILTSDVPVLKMGEIHSRFEPLLETGRTSCGDPYNLQNPLRKGGVRECFVPRPGFVFVDADYDGIELRTWAQVCLWAFGESRLAETLNAGFDPHLDLGAQILGITYEEALRRKKDADVRDARQMAKPASFGYPGGMGAATFSKWVKANYGLSISEQQAAQLKEQWFRNWPEARKYFKWVTDKTKNEWHLVDGEEVCRLKQFVSNRYRGGCSYTETCNGFFQSLAADIFKAAGFKIARACYDETRGSILFGSRIVNGIHDQFLVESPEEIGHECAQEVGWLMIQAAKPFIPDVPATCTPILARCWSKEAEACYDGNRRLVPWDVAPF